MEVNFFILGIQLGIYVSLIIVLKVLYFDPALKLLKRRSELTDGRVQEAHSLQNKILDLRNEYESRMSEVRHALHIERTKTLSRIREVTDKKISETRLNMEDQLNSQRRKIETELSKIQDRLPEWSAQIAKEITNAVLTSKVVRL